MKFAFIEAEKTQWPVEVLCEVLSVSRSGYYAWKDRPPSTREVADARLLVEIKSAYAVGRGNYGSPRVQRELRRRNKRVAAIADYIDGFYNVTRLHSSIGYVSPVEFELQLMSTREAA